MPPFVARKRRRPQSPPATTPLKKAKTILDAVDGSASPNSHADKAFLESLGNSNDSSSSDAESSNFEDVLPEKREPAEDDSGNEDSAWVDALPPKDTALGVAAAAPSGNLELVLNADQDVKGLASTKKGPSKIERQIRIATHCAHVQFLMFHNAIRNAWACDSELQRILLSPLSPQLQKGVEDWRRDCGDCLKSESGSVQPNGDAEGLRPGKGKTLVRPRAQRDWGPPAERQEVGAPNLSRGDPTIRLLNLLASYWRKKFNVTAPGLRKQGYRPIRALEEDIKSWHKNSHDACKHGERINGLDHFKDLARICQGSRDVGAQLFAALLRGLGIEARLVTNLQPSGFGWSKQEEAPPKKIAAPAAGSAGMRDPVDKKVDEAETASAVPSEPANEELAPSRPARRSRSGGTGAQSNPIDLSDTSDLSDAPSLSSDQDLSISDAVMKPSRTASKGKFDKDLAYPIYWVEAISPVTNEVIPVDPIVLVPSVVTSPEQLAAFEPRGSRAEKARQVFAYVIAYSPDGTAKDVTTRYLKRHMWPGKTKGFRMPAEKVPILNKHGKVKRYEERDWFKRVMSSYTRHDRLRTLADDIEDAKDLQPVKVERKAPAEGEETLQSYKQSADYVLERHLRREEALIQGAKPVRIFKAGKGDGTKEEPVYRRKDVVLCKTEESWHKEGRRPKAKEVANPLKWVPIRAVTMARKREVEEAARQLNGEKPMQGLYAKDQTEYIIPPPIEDGVIPKNKFGNIDCFVPSMVPKGAVHVPLRGTVRVCKKLGIDFAEAVTGFEFGNKLAVPVIDGVVVASENEDILIDAWEEEEAKKRVKEDEKRNKLILGTWRKFLMGLRIVERVREEYGEDSESHLKDEINAFTNRKKLAPTSTGPTKTTLARQESDDDLEGGFIHGDQDVDEVSSPTPSQLEELNIATHSREPEGVMHFSKGNIAKREYTGEGEGAERGIEASKYFKPVSDSPRRQRGRGKARESNEKQGSEDDHSSPSIRRSSRLARGR